jgi:hypothetical protein
VFPVRLAHVNFLHGKLVVHAVAVGYPIKAFCFIIEVVAAPAAAFL